MRLCLLLLPLFLLNAQEQRVITQNRVLPRVLAGNNWETGIVLFNPGSTSVVFREVFLAADGKPAAFVVRGQGIAEDVTTSAIEGVLAPGATLNLSVSAPPGEAREGWSLLAYDAAAGTLDGYAKLRHRSVLAGISFEVTLPLGDLQDTAEYMPFDNTEGFRSQVTLINPAGNLSTQVRLTFLSSRGAVILIDSVTLRPAQQMTLSLPDIYPDLANQTGAVFIQADTDRLSVAGLRYNDTYGAIAPLPAIPGPPTATSAPLPSRP